MQRTALLSMLFVAACGGGSETQNVQVPTATATASVAPEPPPAALGVPRDAPFVATFDISTVASVFGTEGHELEHELKLPQGSLSGDLSAFGVDTKRPAAFVVAPVTPEAAAFVHDVRTAPGSLVDTIHKFRAIKLVFGFRILLPAADSAKLATKMGDLLGQAGWSAKATGYYSPHEAAAIKHDASWVAIDIASSLDTPDLAALERVLSGPVDPPAPQREALHAVWSPATFAPVPYLASMTTIIGALSGEGIDPAQRERIFALGLKETSGTFALADHEGKPFFERIELSASAAPFEITVHATPTAGLPLPAGGAAPSMALLFPGARVDLSGNLAWMMAATVFPQHPFMLGRDVGPLGMLVGLPEIFMEAPRDISALGHEAGPPDEVAIRFERIGESWNASNQEIWYGVLPQNTTREKAQCSLATTKCDGATKLPIGKTTKAGHGFAKAVEIDKRWVLLLAREATALDAKPTAASVSPLHFEADTKDLAAELHTSMPMPPRIVGDAARDADGTLVFRFTSR